MSARKAAVPAKLRGSVAVTLYSRLVTTRVTAAAPITPQMIPIAASRPPRATISVKLDARCFVRRRRSTHASTGSGCPELVEGQSTLRTLSAVSAVIVRRLIGDKQPCGALDLGVAWKKDLLERRRIRNRRVERADDADGRVEVIKRLLLNDGGKALADAAGP